MPGYVSVGICVKWKKPELLSYDVPARPKADARESLRKVSYSV